MTAASVRTAITFIRPAATRTHGDVVLENSGQELGRDGCKLAPTHYSVARNAVTCAVTAFKFVSAPESPLRRAHQTHSHAACSSYPQGNVSSEVEK